MGTQLSELGMKNGANPELENINFPERVKRIAENYANAGSDIVYSNTFGASLHKLPDNFSPSDIIPIAVKNAREGISKTSRDVLVALDIGPTGIMTEISGGTASFEEAYDDFALQVKAAVNSEYPPDLAVIETMSDLLETKAAVLAVKEHSDLPVIVTMTFESNARTFTGTPLSAFAVTIEGLGADAIGINCSQGPKEYAALFEELSKYTELPLVAKANAGMPDPETGKYNVTPEEFADDMAALVKYGVKIFGGCCGTTPEFIKALCEKLADKKYHPQPEPRFSTVSSARKTVIIDRPRIIGERINPTGKKIFKEALKNSDIGYIVRQAAEQDSAGADILDVNVSLPDIDEANMSRKSINAISAVCDLPLQIDSSSPAVIESSLRIYAGKPIVNSVNGEISVLEKILPVVKKYGAAVVGLTLDENGIPKSAEARFAIAERILQKALSYGIRKEDVYIDCLTLTASAEQENVYETVKAVRMVKEKLGCKTVLGVSNISFGLPNRELVNEHFLAMALSNGLDLPIINPNVSGMVGAVRAYNLLRNIDKNALEYIAAYSGEKAETSTNKEITLEYAIRNGLSDETAKITRKLLDEVPPMDIVDNKLIPVLDAIGAEFEQGKLFLPQLIMAANTVTQSFNEIKRALAGTNTESKGKVILATVKGDVHDIGKNIVKVLMENYGFEVIDLGKDVPPETVLDAAIKSGAKLVGLSALMTTTLASMEATIKLLKENNVDCKTVVGGAVLTAEYAEKIGADYYAKDAKQSVDIARRIYS
ncbi:MAG: homocysteine S-methyltransferase family protein [Ruminococcus sp.]|nr:homocysteine S-methyltransferase family protein [Ruminococcus sp.]